MQDFYEDEIKLFSETADVVIYFTVQLSVEIKSWRPITGVRLEHAKTYIESIEFDSFQATEYLDIGTKETAGEDEDFFLNHYPQFALPWATFKYNLEYPTGGVNYV